MWTEINTGCVLVSPVCITKMMHEPYVCSSVSASYQSMITKGS